MKIVLTLFPGWGNRCLRPRNTIAFHKVKKKLS